MVNNNPQGERKKITDSLSLEKIVNNNPWVNYNYRQKDAEGKSVRVYGTVKR